MDTAALQVQFRLSASVIQRNLEGVSHAESLRPPAAGSSLNWVLGHVVHSRNEALPLLGLEQPFPMDELDVYRASPEGHEERLLPLEVLVERFEALQGLMEEGLASIDPATLAAPAPRSPTGNPDETVGSLLAVIAYHEAYHAGQTGLLRRLLGKPGAIVAPR